MRDTDTLFNLKDIATFCQYLYLSDQNKITINNGLTDLTLSMTDDLKILCRNETFPDLPEMDYTTTMYPSQILNIVRLLKEQPAIEFPENYENRWAEIKALTEIQLSLNKI